METTVGAIAGKSHRNNLILGIVGALICLALFGWIWAVGFLLGLGVGMINLLLLFRAAVKGVTLDPESARIFMIRRYALRFLLTLGAVGLLVVKYPAGPIPIMTGFCLTLFVMIGTFIANINGNISNAVGGAR